ncbi:LVIVD repeat protein [Bythopirellula goksoeyrii]|uniref:LVIVD repeat protein n=2 Tax=Bythopirellula goksoeyrii TaxID=1400387 RepID=A0A5B9QKW3_9BACT|nr:LVIVD repeat protein [Bythopirellula goksoeyrii]
MAIGTKYISPMRTFPPIQSFLVCWLFVPLMGISNVQGHDVGDVQPLLFTGYLAPFGNNKSTTYTDVWGEGDLAVLGSLESGVAIIQDSGTGPLNHIGTFLPSSPRQFQDVKISGDYGFFSSPDGGGTFVVDLSDPAVPTEVAQINVSTSGHNNVRNATLGNGYLYQLDEASALIHVFDIGMPASPQFVRTMDTGDSVGIYDATLVGDRLYASGLGGTAGEGAVYVYDIADIGASNPTLLGKVATGANTSSAALTYNGQYLAVTHREVGGDIGIWDISNLSQPTLASFADASDLGLTSYSASEVLAVGDLLYVAWWQAGVQLLDLDNDLLNRGVQLIGQFDTSNFTSPLEGFVGNQSVFPWGGHERVLLSDSQWGLHVVNSTNVLPRPPNADFDEDGKIDGADFLVWQRGFGILMDAILADGDANGDGRVDALDLSVWRDQYSLETTSSLQAINLVPEPPGILIAALTMLTLVARNCIQMTRFRPLR